MQDRSSTRKDTALCVLAIDDDREDLAILKHHFKRFGQPVDVVTFVDPDEGLAQLAAREVDAVLVDHHLGTRTGLELLADLQGAAPDTPIILVTDCGDEETAVAAMRDGFADYLPKQVLSPKCLQRSITNAIEKMRLRRSLREYREDLERNVTALDARNREIQSFYHSLSHEIKTPLTAAREFTSIVLDGLQGPLTPDQRESLQTVKDACDQMVVFLNDLLDASRLETGKLALHRAPTDLGALVDRVVTHFAATARAKELALNRSVPEGLPPANVDEGRILQVLQNLVGNALKFTSAGGAVHVSVDLLKEDGALRVAVRDTGRGIAADQLERIFERLYQTSEEDAVLHAGLGLGLNLCRELVHLHGGEIRATSVVGEGSTFTFTVPAHELAAVA